jgi:hypothetical protein
MGSLIDVPWWGGSSGSCGINFYVEQGGLDEVPCLWLMDISNHDKRIAHFWAYTKERMWKRTQIYNQGSLYPARDN